MLDDNLVYYKDDVSSLQLSSLILVYYKDEVSMSIAAGKIDQD